MPPYDSLSECVASLEDAGELVRIPETVSPELEVTAVARRFGVGRGAGPAILFERIAGSPHPLLVNLFGSRDRVCRLLGLEDFDDLAVRIAEVIRPHVPAGWWDALRLVPQTVQFAALPPRVAKSGPSQQVVRMGSDVDLGRLPFPRCWPSDSGRAITGGVVFTSDPERRTRDIDRTPLTILDGRTLAVHWTVHDDGWRNLLRHRERGATMPVAVALGTDPATTFAAGAPLPPDTDPLLLAGLVRGRPVDLVPARTLEFDVPAHAEVVIEGRIDPAAPTVRVESLGRSTGYAGLPEDLPVLEVTAVTQRANPLLGATIPCGPPGEEHWLGRLTERCLVPFARLFVPELTDLHFPTAGGFRHLVFASIRKEHPFQGRKVLAALWALPGLERTKVLVVVDDDVDVRDEPAAWARSLAAIDPQRDAGFWPGPVSFLDHATTVPGVAGRLGIDATRKTPAEGHTRPWPEPLALPSDLEARIAARWGAG